MWNYKKCTTLTRKETLMQLEAAFHDSKDCAAYLSQVQPHINSTQTTIVLLQDLDANVLIEMDYVPVNDYVFRVVNIAENGIKEESLSYSTIEQAVKAFAALIFTDAMIQ